MEELTTEARTPAQSSASLNFEEATSLIRKLTKAQAVALSRICIGDDSCLNPNTAKSLANLGLIDYGLVSEGRGLSLYRAEVASIAVHMAWCRWCDELIPGDALA